MALKVVLSILALSASNLPAKFANALAETDRLIEYHKRNYTWPIKEYVPNTPGWKRLYDHRFRQIAEMKHSNKRYEGYLQAIQSSFMAPNFTVHGFGLGKAPDDLMEALRQGIHDGVAAGPDFEPEVDVIEGDQPWFIDRPDLTQRVLEELQHFPETWAGMELVPFRAYGFRLYRNGSNLNMHVDRSQTHIVSFILHIDSSEDSEPWPILIEDFHGNTHEVVLKSGDILFYESSKCFHGRPRPFKGSWYSSVFVHYYPKYGWAETDHDLEKHYAVPPVWKTPPTSHFEIPLDMLGTSMKEPMCPNSWCQSQYTKEWTTPSEHGYWVAPTGEKFPFHPKKIDCIDNHEDCAKWASWDTDECRTNAGYMMEHCKRSCGACGTERKDEL